MGEQAPITSCTIICNGQGPVVSAQPVCLNFGEIQVLQNKIMNFHIINDSPIPAQFKLTSVNHFQIIAINNKFTHCIKYVKEYYRIYFILFSLRKNHSGLLNQLSVKLHRTNSRRLKSYYFYATLVNTLII